MEKITQNVYVEIGTRGCNASFVNTREGVVMIDTPMVPADAIRWRDEIAKFGPVRYLINSEPHPDHFSGNFFFGGTVVGHEGTRETILKASPNQFKGMLQQGGPVPADFAFRAPTLTLSERMTLYLGDHAFQLINFPGHTPYQVAVVVPEEGVVFTSDNVVNGVPPFMHQALPFEWIKSLKKMKKLGARIMVPGHGGVCPTQYLDEMIHVVESWIDAVQTAIDQGLTVEQAQREIKILERYGAAGERMGMVQNNNIAHLYEVLTAKTKRR